MIFQIQKEYKYLAGMIFLFILGCWYFYPYKFYFFFILTCLIFIANKPYKVNFVENHFIEIHRLIGKKRIKFDDIKQVTRGTHKNAVIFDGGIIYLSHLIERVNTLTDLIENSVRPKEVPAKTLERIGEATKSSDPSSSELIKMAIRGIIVVIVLSVIGVLLFIKLAKSLY